METKRRIIDLYERNYSQREVAEKIGVMSDKEHGRLHAVKQ